MIKIPLFLNTLLNKAKSLVMEELNPDVASGQSIPEILTKEPSDVSQSPAEVQPTPVKLTWLKGLSAVFNGLGIGLLLGILLGLSISPVVSAVIASVSTALGLFLGLNEKYLDPLKSLRIGAFGFFAVCGILLGLYIRANDAFAPSMLEKKNEYVAVGFSEAEARAFITKSIQADTGKTRREAGVLYSSTLDVGACDVLTYADAGQSSSEIENTFIQAKGVWKEFAETFKNDLPDAIVGQSLLTMRDCFCGISSTGIIKMTNLSEVRKLEKNDSIEMIEKVLSVSGDNWKAILTKVQENIPENYRKDLYLSIIKVLSHD